MVASVNSETELAGADAWAMPVAHRVTAAPGNWLAALASIAVAVAAESGVEAPVQGEATAAAQAVARSLLSGERKAILLGNAAAHHAQASQLLALAQWLGAQTGASVGYLTEAANTVGAQWVGAQPAADGLNAAQMLAGGLKATVLLNNEPEFDSAAGAQAVRLGQGAGSMVVTLSPFKANMAFSDVLLPIAPFTETSGTFVNAEGRIQSFHAVVKPQGDARPAWKVLRVLGNLLGLPGFDFESSQDVLAHVRGVQGVAATHVAAERLDNGTAVAIQAVPGTSAAVPAVAAIYALDGLVRRATSLQLTADARATSAARNVTQEAGVAA